MKRLRLGGLGILVLLSACSDRPAERNTSPPAPWDYELAEADEAQAAQRA